MDLSDASIQSLELKFTFNQSEERLLIGVQSKKEKIDGNIGLQQARELLEAGEFRILERDSQYMRIELKQIELEFISKLRFAKGELEEKVNQLQKDYKEQQKVISDQRAQIDKCKLTQDELLMTINALRQSLAVQTDRLQQYKKNTVDIIKQNQQTIGKLKQELQNQQKKVISQGKLIEGKDRLIGDLQKQIYKAKGQNSILDYKNLQLQQELTKLRLTVKAQNKSFGIVPQKKQFQWSNHLKGPAIKVEGSVVQRTSHSTYSQLALLAPGFDYTVNDTQKWAIRYKAQFGWICVGMCVRSIIEKAEFNMSKLDWKNSGNGCYLIDTNGYSYSHSDQEYNQVSRSFRFNQGDVITIEYDPIEERLRFIKNGGCEQFEMPVGRLGQDEEYFACVALRNCYDSVGLVLQ